MQKVRVGIIGAGTIGNTHIKAFSEIEDAEIVGVADPNKSALEKVEKEYNITQLYTDYSQMLKKEKLDAVVVCAPNFLHTEITCAALKKDLWVLLEKPMSTDTKGAKKILEAEKKSKGFVMLAFCHRYRAEIQLMKRMIENGRLGEIYHAFLSLIRRRGIPGLGGWFTTKKLSGGGPLIDIGCHIIDFTLYLLGYPKPVEVYAGVYSKFGKRMKEYVYVNMWAGPPKYDGIFDVEDFATAIIRLENGATLTLEASWAANTKYEEVLVHLYGDKAGARIEIGKCEIFGEDNGYLIDSIPYFKKTNIYVEEDKDFIRCIKEEKKPSSSSYHGFIVQSIIESIYKSGKTGHSIKVKV